MQNNDPRDQMPGPGRDMRGGFKTIVAAMIALLLGGLMAKHTVDYIAMVAAMSYPPEIVDLFEIAWTLLCYPFVFFAARASVLFAVTAAGVYLASRLM
ncbi:hypothetical protein [Pontivivens ytuae]|uniref:Uncharacterized protein n=1 Tax=Pontivivens ytuae TaxID=2789856 RepID=A0A7S9LT15_9RHOB|nr:hypothetical protein [Pontivivens ytuae]QPH54751.1 hypothetical protein I0K15_02940 [Pontivivens ytuae]